MKRKKSRFWLFWFSLIPGAGEMYLGFMNMGLSLMGIFLGICFLASLLQLGPLLFFNIIIWFYGFFHAHNLSSLPDDEFYALDDYYLFNMNQFTIKIFSRKTRIFIAWALIIIGSLRIIDNSLFTLQDFFPDASFGILWKLKALGIQLLVGAGIIFVGIQLILGKNEEMENSY